MDNSSLPGNGQDVVQDKDAFRAGVRVAASVIDTATTTVEEAIALWGPLLFAYLRSRGMSIQETQLPAVWSTVVSFCDGYAKELVRCWGHESERMTSERVEYLYHSRRPARRLNNL